MAQRAAKTGRKVCYVISNLVPFGSLWFVFTILLHANGGKNKSCASHTLIETGCSMHADVMCIVCIFSVLLSSHLCLNSPLCTLS